MVAFSFHNQTLWCDHSLESSRSGHIIGFGWEIRKHSENSQFCILSVTLTPFDGLLKHNAVAYHSMNSQFKTMKSTYFFYESANVSYLRAIFILSQLGHCKIGQKMVEHLTSPSASTWFTWCFAKMFFRSRNPARRNFCTGHFGQFWVTALGLYKIR